MMSTHRWRRVGLLTVALLLWPLLVAAAPLPADRFGSSQAGLAQDDQLLTLYSSYEWKNDLPGQCPSYPPIFRTGTRTVHSYLPATVKQEMPVVVIWQEAVDGTVQEDPVATARAVLAPNTLPHASISFNQDVGGRVFLVTMLLQDDAGKWTPIAQGVFGIASSTGKPGAPGECPIPDSMKTNGAGIGGLVGGASVGGSGDTAAATPTPAKNPAPKPTPTKAPATSAAASPLQITWTDMSYEGRAGDSRWCQTRMIYVNKSKRAARWPEYRPGIQIVNGDGSEDGWYLASFYSKADGWENGIDPNNIPAIAPGASADWTWYSATDRAGQFCATIGLVYQGWTYTASFDRTGKLLGSKTFPPK